MSRVFLPHVITDDSALGGLEIERSFRFNSSDNTRLTRTPSSNGNKRTWTISLWIKKSISSTVLNGLMVSGTNNPDTIIKIDSDRFEISRYGGSYTNRVTASAPLRDFSAWYHLVGAVDTTQSTAANRVRLYINGTEVTDFANSSYPSENYEYPEMNDTGNPVKIGHHNTDGTPQQLDGYLAEFNFIDGTALTPSSFGFTDSQTGIWMPKRFEKSSIPNKKGTTFSSTWTASGNGFGGSNPITNAFDGDLSTSANNDGGGQILTWNTSTYNLRGELRIYCRSSSGVYDIYVNGNSGNTTKVGDTPSSNGWVDCGTFDHIKEIQFAGTTYNTGTGLGSAGVHILAIMVDGTLLRNDMPEYGTNGFYLDFSDNSSTTTLGIDKSPNGNDFTLDNSNTEDSMLDTPTNNFPTMNPLTNYSGLSQGNLRFNNYNDSGGNRSTQATIALPKSGKWYWEARYQESGTGTVTTKYFGVSQSQLNTGYLTAPYVYYDRTHIKNGNNSEDITHGQDWYNGVGVPAILGCAVNVDNNTVSFYHNNTLQGTITLPTLTSSQEYFFTWANTSGGSSGSLNDTFNFGADSTFQGQVSRGNNTDANGIGDFKYAPPSGHLALCSKNLPSKNVPSIIRPQRHFDTLLWSGDNVDGRLITGLEFKPDLIWVKTRNQTNWHWLTDTVRGAPNKLYANDNSAEDTAPIYGQADSLNASGFVAGGGTDGSNPLSDSNQTGTDYVAWCWKAGGAAVSNSDGTVTSSISVNREAGFSIVTYTGNATASQTVGHGLGTAPNIVITKRRSGSDNWQVYWNSQGSGQSTSRNGFLNLNNSWNQPAHVDQWGGAVVTSTTFPLGASDVSNNGSGDTYVSYCWTGIPGYSKFGEYTGNGSSDGQYIHLGFRPAFVMIKKTDSSEGWEIFDNKRDPDNVIEDLLEANTNAASITTVDWLDFLSNGMKHRIHYSNINTSGSTYVYMAFAEEPGTTPYDTFPNAR